MNKEPRMLKDINTSGAGKVVKAKLMASGIPDEQGRIYAADRLMEIARKGRDRGLCIVELNNGEVELWTCLRFLIPPCTSRGD